MSLTPLAVSALALLNERPMHPYEMYQLLLARHEDQLVKVRPGSLYHAVERLEQQQLVEVVGTEREGNRPERTTYAITDAGYTALVDQLREWLSTPAEEYPRFPVALAEAHNGPADLVTADLGRYVVALDEQIAHLEQIVTTLTEDDVPEPYWIEADYLITIRRAERDWISRLIDRIETKDLPWHPTP
ncbi:MAG: PadR family transcriptional regulator [Aeromicrobium erythreum]